MQVGEKLYQPTLPRSCTVKQTRKMDQQEGKWFMNNLRAMIQDELKQALAGLIPLPAVETTLISDIVQPTPTILPAVIAPTPSVVASPIALIVARDPLNDNARG